MQIGSEEEEFQLQGGLIGRENDHRRPENTEQDVLSEQKIFLFFKNLVMIPSSEKKI